MRWALWSKWSPPDNKCESRRIRQCQNCLADGTCFHVPKNDQTCIGDHREVQYDTNKPGCSEYL